MIPIYENKNDLFRDSQKSGFDTIPAMIIKNFMSKSECDQIIVELMEYKITVPEQNPEDPYPAGKRNFHMPVKVENQDVAAFDRTQYPIDFWEKQTRLHVHNFRFGDINDPEIQKKLPVFQKCGLRVLDFFNQISGQSFPHGAKLEPNMYLEVSHYPVGKGFIEKHTHYRNLIKGQAKTFVTILTQDEIDHKDSGLIIEFKDQEVDTTKTLNQGDSILFDLTLPHFVNTTQPTSISPRKTESQGRWVISLFYY